MAKEKGQEGAVTDALNVPKARVLAEVFAPNGKIRVELLPEGAGGSAEGGSVDLQPLEKRVAALEAKPAAEPVDLTPLSERVSALENAPKVEDKSQEVTALQGVVSEHTTTISSNVQRITALESKTVPEGFDSGVLTKRVEALENKGFLTREKMCLLDVEFNGIADVAHYVTHGADSLSLYNKFIQTKGCDVLRIVSETYPIGPEPKTYIFYCLTDGLTYKFKADGDNEGAEVFFNIPGIGELHVRSEYYIQGSIISSTEHNTVAYQLKKLLGLS